MPRKKAGEKEVARDSYARFPRRKFYEFAINYIFDAESRSILDAPESIVRMSN